MDAVYELPGFGQSRHCTVEGGLIWEIFLHLISKLLPLVIVLKHNYICKFIMQVFWCDFLITIIILFIFKLIY